MFVLKLGFFNIRFGGKFPPLHTLSFQVKAICLTTVKSPLNKGQRWQSTVG